MGVKLSVLVEKFAPLITPLSGSLDLVVDRIQTPALAQASDLIFITKESFLKIAQGSKGKMAIVPKNLAQAASSTLSGWTLMTSPAVGLAMARTAAEFFPVTKHRQAFEGHAIHPSAIIAKSAQLAPGVIIGPNAVIGERVKIGKGSFIGAGCVIESDVEIGTNLMMHPLVFVGHDCQIGNDCEIKANCSIGGDGFGFAQDEKFNHTQVVHYGRVVIEDRVRVGAGVQIDRGTFEDSRFGAGSKIDNHCHFGHNFRCGKNCLFTGGFLAAGSVTIGDNCVFGGRTILNGHIHIASNAQFAGLTGISKSITKPGKYGGYPTQPLKDSLRSLASLHALPSLRRQMNRVLDKLGMPRDEEDVEE